MTKKTIMKVLLPLILLLLMLFDSQLSNALRPATGNQLFLNSHFLLVGLILGCLYFPKRYMVILSVVIGVIFDVYYYSIVGINMVSLPLTVLLVYVVFTYVHPSFFSLLLSLVIFITIMDGSVYLLRTIFKLDNGSLNLLSFITNNLGPTLIMNIALFVLLVFPFKKLVKF